MDVKELLRRSEELAERFRNTIQAMEEVPRRAAVMIARSAGTVP